MDLQGQIVADNDRYAFLLGSALKNDDSEQFFCIYDSIIPKDLSDSQLEKIKEKARYIADLPEDEFNELVVNARDYSLARGRPPPSLSSAMSSGGHCVLDIPSDDDEEGRVSPTARVPQLNFCTSALPHKGNATGMTDDDSGLPSSTKSGRRTSLSSEDTAEVEEKGAVRSMKPFANPDPKRGQKKEEEEEERESLVPRLRVSESVVVKHTYNPQYDEEVMVEHDNESVESPRSDASSTREYDVTQMDNEDLGGGSTEMTTFSSEQHGYCDDDDSDENIHRTLYGQHSFRSAWSMARPRASSTSSLQFSRSSSMLAKGQTISSLRSGSATAMTRSIDDSVQFSTLRSPTPSRYSPDCISALSCSPPFGKGENLLSNIGNSISPLLQMQTPSYNLSKAETGADGTSGDGKKKKKKKKDTKDESTREGGSRSKPLMSADLNGNPLVPQLYHQMRKPPSPNENNSPVSGSRGRGQIGSSNHDFSGGRGDLQEMGNKTEDPTSPTGSGQAEKRKSKKNARQPGKDVHPEQDPNYVGNIPDVDNLVKFVNNEIGEKKLKKISKSPSDSAGSRTPSATAAPANKTQKKTKDRNKTKQFVTTGVGESTEDSLTPASETTQLLSCVSLTSSYSTVGEHIPREQTTDSGGNRAGSPDAQNIAKEMGNSSTSEKPGGDEDVILEDNSEPLKNHKVQELSVGTALPVKPVADAQSEATKNHKNHMLSSSARLAPTAKKDQVSETKDSKDKGKPKSGGKDNIKSETAPSTDNNTNKKLKSKAPKSDVKPSPVSEKSSTMEGKKEVKVDASKDTAKAKHAQKTATSPPASAAPKTPTKYESAIENNDFIFTDVDPIPIVKQPEQEFILVKRKKRSPVQLAPQGQSGSAQSFSPAFSPHYHSKDSQHPLSSSQVSSGPYNRNGLRETSSRPPPSKTRSCTPPPTPIVAGPETVEKMRDLSPSSFPELSTTPGRVPARVNPLGTEARRRSLEDVTFGTGQLLPFDKDSDKESTKSLPADKGVGGRGGVSYPVSYATMASTTKTPRQSVDSSKAESVSSSMEDANIEEFPATPTTSMKWKGSPQERRHSIGSAPEELSKPATGSSLQRSGSQEVLPRDVDALDKSVPMAVPGAKGMTQSDSAGSFVGSDADSARGSEAGSEATGEVFASHPPGTAAATTTTTTLEDRRTVSVEEVEVKAAALASKTSTIPAGSVSSAPSQTVTIAVSGSSGRPAVVTPAVSTAAKSKGTQSSSSSRSQSAAVAISSKVEATCNTSSLGPKPVNNGHKHRRDVVVFYTNYDSSSIPMDFSFGGEPVFSCGEDGGSSASATAASSSGDKSAAGCVPPAKDTAHSSSGSSNTSHPAAAQASAASPPPSCSDVNPSTKPPKGPHIAGLNGLVSPQQRLDSTATVVAALPPASTVPSTPSSGPAPAQGQAVSQTSTAGVGCGQAVKGVSVAQPVGHLQVLPPPTQQQPSGDRVPDGVPLRVPTGGIAVTIGAKVLDQLPQLKVFLSKEVTAEAGQSTIDAANHLLKEWRKIERQSKNAANSVVVYSQVQD